MTILKGQILSAIDDAFLEKVKDQYRGLVLQIDSDLPSPKRSSGFAQAGDRLLDREFENFKRGLENLKIAHERALVIAAKVFGALALALFLFCGAHAESGLPSPQRSFGFAQAGIASIYACSSGLRTANG